MDLRTGITCDHKCKFSWSAFEAQYNKANRFPGVINIIVLCWISISKELFKPKKKKTSKKKCKNELLFLLLCQIKKKIPDVHSATSPNLPNHCQPL